MERSAPDPVKLSSDVAGDTVQITIRADAIATLTSATDITIDLKKFGVPSAIQERSVNIADDDSGPGNYVGEPQSVTVNGTKVTLALYSRFPGAEDSAARLWRTGAYTVTIKQSAGITNPIVAGTATITVKDADATDETLEAGHQEQGEAQRRRGRPGSRRNGLRRWSRQGRSHGLPGAGQLS